MGVLVASIAAFVACGTSRSGSQFEDGPAIGQGPADCLGCGTSDGSTARVPLATLGLPYGLVACAHAIFYADDTNAIYRVSVGSSSLKLAEAPNVGFGIGCDDAYVYWSGTFADAGVNGNRTQIFRVPVAGGEVELVATAFVEPGLQVANGSVYFVTASDDGGAAIARVATAGDGGTEVLSRIANYPASLRPFGARAGDVVSMSGTDIVSIPLDGGAAVTLVFDAGAANVVANHSSAFFQGQDGVNSTLRSADVDAGSRTFSFLYDLCESELHIGVARASDAGGDIEILDMSDLGRSPFVAASSDVGVTAIGLDDDHDSVIWIEPVPGSNTTWALYGAAAHTFPNP